MDPAFGSQKFHTTDEFYNVPSTWFGNTEGTHAEEMEDPEDANHVLHEAPESVQNLSDALQSEGVVIGPRIEESVFFLTRLIHHINSLQCCHYRVIELNGHWRLWFQDIANAWQDRINPQDQMIFDVCRKSRSSAHCRQS